MPDTGLFSRLRGLGSVVAIAMAVTGCISTDFLASRTMIDERAYTAIYPYFAEFCAVSEFSKKKGSGVDLDSGGPGGHAVFYLNGACRVQEARYPELALCGDPPDRMAGRGVGISVNEHYRNANWVATEGRDFFYDGDIAPGEGVSRIGYARTQEKAKAMGILDGVVFHRKALADKPAGMSERDFMYEVSIATDYGIDLARDRYCARVPLDRGRMSTIVHYLNALNEPYRSGREEFHWNVLRDNCAYLAHNALASVGFWPAWSTERSLFVAAFNFPVPKNEFVNLMRLTNDMDIADPEALYADDRARATLHEQGRLLTKPGALAEARPAMKPNDVYNTNLRLIFYDDPTFGHYQSRFERIFHEPRYTDLGSNLMYFSTLYATILARHREPDASPARAAFGLLYDDVITREKFTVDATIAHMHGATGQGS
jgi:hypothetical protein